MSIVKIPVVLVLSISLSVRGLAQQETDARLHPVGRKWGFYQAPDTTKRKRVLMIGDSILGGYWEAVSDALKDSVAVDCWITPLHEGDPELFNNLAQIMTHGPYNVIHFNIGLHGWQEGRVDESRYAFIMQHYIDALKAGSPRARMIWASTTPVTVKDHPTELNGEINPIIARRNNLAGTVMKRNKVDIDDLYSLMIKNLQMARGDMFHWKPEGVRLEAGSVLGSIRRCLPDDSIAQKHHFFSTFNPLCPPLNTKGFNASTALNYSLPKMRMLISPSTSMIFIVSP